MPLHLTVSRQRVPMLDASTLEHRTRPLLDGSVAARLRHFTWSQWRPDTRHRPRYESVSTGARLERR